MSTRFILLTLLAGLTAGCSQHSDNMVNPSSAVVRVVPEDGATGVALDSPVTVRFGVSVDRAVTERGLHLISGYDMAHPTCPDSLWHYHGSMMTVMGDSSGMRHMDEYHSAHGQFGWNPDGTQCLFRPDSLLRPGTQYMIHMDRDMVRMMDSRMGGMGGMMGNGSGTMSGDMMYHFTTTGAATGARAERR
jgi:hypothetical protein